MSDTLLRLYHTLPFPARSMFATLHGVRLKRWRYGDETERLVSEAMEREQWSPADWNAWRTKKLAFVLHHAFKHVPYYRDLWAKRRRAGNNASYEYIENWPILEKESLRKNPYAFLADGCDPNRMYHVHTSGTTGKSLDLWRNRLVERYWYALFEARCRRWHNVSLDLRWAILGGQLVTATHKRRPPFWVWNGGLNQLYMSSYHLAPDLVPFYLDALKRYRITYLCGYTSALYELAQEVIRSGRTDIKMNVALTNAEPVFAYQRQTIERAFQCPVRETYGMAELIAAASECESGSLHLWPEVGSTEVVNRMNTETDQSGDLLGTGLININMPLIRYRVGDCVTIGEAGVSCSCGRRLPLLTSISGRLDDVLFTTDGRRIGRLDPVFKSQLPIREAQVVQQTLRRIKVRYVPAADYTAAAGDAITERLRARMGDIQVIMEPVAEIPRSANGKFRAVICELSPELKLSLNNNN